MSDPEDEILPRDPDPEDERLREDPADEQLDDPADDPDSAGFDSTGAGRR